MKTSSAAVLRRNKDLLTGSAEIRPRCRCVFLTLKLTAPGIECNQDGDWTQCVLYACVDDYLNMEDKLKAVATHGAVKNLPTELLTIDKYGDWLDQRREEYSSFIKIVNRNNERSVFSIYSNGMQSGRDTWSYNFSAIQLKFNFDKTIEFYNQEVSRYKSNPNSYEKIINSSKMKWDKAQIDGISKQRFVDEFKPNLVVIVAYRPFVKQSFYYDKFWIHRTGQFAKMFPGKENNLIITCSGKGTYEFSCLMTNSIVDVKFIQNGLSYPRYLYQNNDSAEGLQGLFTKVDAISQQAIAHFKAVYTEPEAAAIDADSVFYYIYGIMHSPDYRSTYADNLSKELPRIPRVKSFADFNSFEKAGRRLAGLHVNYENSHCIPAVRSMRLKIRAIKPPA